MPLEKEQKIVQKYFGQYKNKGINFKKFDMELFLYQTYIEGIGCWGHRKGIQPDPSKYKIQLTEIDSLKMINFNGTNAIRIDYSNDSSLLYYNEQHIIIPISNCIEAINTIENAIKNAKETDKEEAIIAKRKSIEESHRRHIEHEKFFNACYEFHIGNKQRPNFELNRMDLRLTSIYLDDDKNLNFLRIDGENQEESNGIIPSAKIHYYEKAGNIHFLTNITGK